MTKLFIFILVLLSSVSIAQTHNWQWAKSIATSTDDDIDRSVEELAAKVALDSKGNTYVAGYFSDSLFYNGKKLSSFPGNNKVDIFLAKYGPIGELLWITTITSPSADHISGLVVNGKSEVFLTGTFRDSLLYNDTVIRSNAACFIAKYSPEGQIEGCVPFGANSVVNDICYDGKNIILIGRYNGTSFKYQDLELKGHSFFIVKLYEDCSPELASDLHDNSAYMNPRMITPDYNGGYFLLADVSEIVISNTLVKPSFSHSSVLHINANGLADRISSMNAEHEAIVSNSSSYCLVGGFRDSIVIGSKTYKNKLQGGNDMSFYAVTYSHSDQQQGVIVSEGKSNKVFAVSADSNGRFIVAGLCSDTITINNTTSTFQSTGNGFVVRLDTLGNASLLNVTNSPFITSVASNGSSDIVVSGFYRDYCSFGNNTLYSATPDPDFFVAKVGDKLSISKNTDNSKSTGLHPNPANSITTLEFTLPSLSPVTITLHDILGREVLRREMDVQAEGQHEESLDVSELPIGSYIVKIRTNGEVFTSRVSVVR